MDEPELSRAVAAAVATASSLELKADDATVLHNSNRIAVRLSPCDVLARVAPEGYESAPFEVEVAHRLAGTDGPVAELDPRVAPRVYVRDGFAITLWTYFEPVLAQDVTPREYARALEQLHDAMRPITDIATPHFTDRVDEALRLVDNAELSPELTDADRQLLSGALRSLTRTILNSGRPEQLLHGEPHAGNVLRTERGLLFIDLQTTCRGPIEFDIAHCSPHRSPAGDADSPWYLSPALPEAVAAEYPAADQDLVRVCWMLMLAMVAAWRWDKRDQFPNGRQMGIEFTNELRAALDRYGIDVGGR